MTPPCTCEELGDLLLVAPTGILIVNRLQKFKCAATDPHAGVNLACRQTQFTPYTTSFPQFHSRRHHALEQRTKPWSNCCILFARYRALELEHCG